MNSNNETEPVEKDEGNSMVVDKASDQKESEQSMETDEAGAEKKNDEKKEAKTDDKKDCDEKDDETNKKKDGVEETEKSTTNVEKLLEDLEELKDEPDNKKELTTGVEEGGEKDASNKEKDELKVEEKAGEKKEGGVEEEKEGGKEEAEEEKRKKEGAEKEKKEEEMIIISIKSQHRTSSLSVSPSTTIGQLSALIQEQYGVLLEQVVLIYRGALLSDSLATMDSLTITNGDVIHLVTRFNPPSEEGSQPQIYLPSQYSRLGLNNIDFVSLQLQMQQQMQANPEMVREMITNPLTQQLMAHPSTISQSLLNLPQAEPMLNRNPDIFDMLNNPEMMNETLEMARNPEQLQQMIDRMPLIENSPYQDGIPMFTEPPQPTPSTTTLLQMTSQHPEMLARMLDTPYFSSMLEGLLANPQWAHQMIVQNLLFLNNPLLKHQINHLLPHCLQQLQNPDIVSLLKDSESLKALMQVQHCINTIQQEAPDLFTSAGLLNTAQPGHVSIDPSTNPDLSSVAMPTRLNRGEIDPTTVMMNQIIVQDGKDDVNHSVSQEERFKEELETMDLMGFKDRPVNLQLLLATFGNIDAAASQLLLQQQQA